MAGGGSLIQEDCESGLGDLERVSCRQYYLFCCCCSAAQLCPTLCDLMDCSMPGFPILPYPSSLPELAQIHVHCQWCIQLSPYLFLKWWLKLSLLNFWQTWTWSRTGNLRFWMLSKSKVVTVNCSWCLKQQLEGKLNKFSHPWGSPTEKEKEDSVCRKLQTRIQWGVYQIPHFLLLVDSGFRVVIKNTFTVTVDDFMSLPYMVGPASHPLPLLVG